MDQLSQEKLAQITAKDLGSLTETDIEFLRARSSYLSEEQRAVFKEVLGDEPQASNDAPEEKPSKKAKKGE